MDAREVKVIDTSGRNGLPGAENWNKHPASAPQGQYGASGKSAGAPTAGQPASDIRVRLAYSSEEPGITQVTGEGPHTGQLWKIARDEKLRLNAKGGDGGAGGRGEDGQAGGCGRDGRNATEHRDGEDGEDGARGGDGGYGSNGADGAAAGNVFITVHEDDTDLLVPLEYDVQGGAGGASGQHGEPGDGGIGGRGGRSHSWVEKWGDRHIQRHRRAGNNGRNGPPGSRPSIYLTGGKSGPQGSIQIKVIRGDLSEATYPSPYSLQVIKFDIIDENRDGVNEPGEHLLVHNIRVKNTGGMPSPETRSIRLLIQGTQFLEPIISDHIELPRSIQPGQEVEVPGILRAYIKNEWSEKQPGESLHYVDDVQLLAIFHERLNRPIPNFCGKTQIVIRYPLRLDAPTYLDCVAKGDRVRFKWVVHNDSTKSYGIEGILKRITATRISDPNRFFNLTHAAEDKPDEATDEIPEIEPNSEIIIDQDFSVDENTLEFSLGFITLELMLADPISGKLRSVTKYQMRMQISGVYSLSPNPSYLLVVNSQTPNHAIHQIIVLLRQRLHTSLDIFNLSLVGSYDSPITQRNVLNSYPGRSVIIFGNNFPFFNQGNKDPWELLDPWETGLLIKGGTSIHFACVGNLESLKQWGANATFPAHDFTAGAQSFNDLTIGGVVMSLRNTKNKELTSNMAVHRFGVKKGLCGTIQKNVDSAAIKAAKKLNKNLPLRRFIVVPDPEATREAEKIGGAIVCEGVPKNSKMMASVGMFPASSTNTISDYDMYFIISCLPFLAKTKMFWNMIGNPDATGLACDVLYTGCESLYSAPRNAAPGQTKVDDKILQALSISLQHDIASEIYRFTSTRPRFADPLGVPEKLAQLTLFSQFFAAAPKTPQVHDIGNAQLLVSTLGAIHAIANPISRWQSMKGAFSFMGNRKGQLTPAANQRIFATVTETCSATVAATVKEHLLQRSKQVKKGIKGTGGQKSLAAFGSRELAVFVKVEKVVMFDLTELKLKPGSVALNSAALQSHQQGYFMERKKTGQVVENVKKVLEEHVNPVDEDDYLETPVNAGQVMSMTRRGSEDDQE